jgi:hypothetical protein
VGQSFPPPIGNRLNGNQSYRNGGWGRRRSGFKPHRERNGIGRRRCRQSVRFLLEQLAVPRCFPGTFHGCRRAFALEFRDRLAHSMGRSFEQYNVSNDTESIFRESELLQSVAGSSVSGNGMWGESLTRCRGTRVRGTASDILQFLVFLRHNYYSKSSFRCSFPQTRWRRYQAGLYRVSGPWGPLLGTALRGHLVTYYGQRFTTRWSTHHQGSDESITPQQ